jgi:hypothetical protein
VNLSLTSGGRRVYGVLTGGYRPGEEGRYVAGLGMGAHFEPTDGFFLEGDLLGQNLFSAGSWSGGEGNALATLRLTAGYDFGGVAVAGGPTFNALARFAGARDVDLGVAPEGAWRQANDDVGAELWPGFHLGLRFF